MPFYLDYDNQSFPSPSMADEYGLLAVGGDLSPERVLDAYKKGIFPWYNPDEPVLWWSPDPRFVLYPAAVKISKSMKQVLRRQQFQVTFDQDFLGVITSCRDVYRPEQGGTWISDDFIDSYHMLHKQGFVHSVEVWQDGELVGGLYGGQIGKCFFGESMFAKVSNASKAGFILMAKNMIEQGFHLIDCQIHSRHLESLGGEFLNRHIFLDTLAKNSQEIPKPYAWRELFHTDFTF